MNKPYRGNSRNTNRYNDGGENRLFDSDRSEARLRGTPRHLHQRYLVLAQEAAATGDRTKAEYYFQHADHYYRTINASADAVPRSPRDDRFEENQRRSGDGGRAPALAPAKSSQPETHASRSPIERFNEGRSQGTNLPGPDQTRSREDSGGNDADRRFVRRAQFRGR